MYSLIWFRPFSVHFRTFLKMHFTCYNYVLFFHFKKMYIQLCFKIYVDISVI